jgi:hypothetical protein
MAATAGMDLTTPRDSVDLAAREALAARSAMGEMAEMEEAGLPLETAHLWPVGLVVPAGTEVPPAAMAATAEQAARHPPRDRIQRPSAEPVERAGWQMMEPEAMAARAVPQLPMAQAPPSQMAEPAVLAGMLLPNPAATAVLAEMLWSMVMRADPQPGAMAETAALELLRG